MKYQLFYILLILFTTNTLAQTEQENWVKVNSDSNNDIFINTVGLEKYTGDDFYVWAIEENDPPIVLESIEKEIHKTQTQYLINKRTRKYSIVKIIYYDEENRFIKQFNYEINDTLPQFKYSYPIYAGSDVDFILSKSLEYIGNTDEK